MAALVSIESRPGEGTIVKSATVADKFIYIKGKNRGKKSRNTHTRECCANRVSTVDRPIFVALRNILLPFRGGSNRSVRFGLNCDVFVTKHHKSRDLKTKVTITCVSRPVGSRDLKFAKTCS